MAKYRFFTVVTVFYCLWIMLSDHAAANPYGSVMPQTNSTIEQDISQIRQIRQKTDSARIFYNKGDYSSAQKLSRQGLAIAENAKAWKLALDNCEILISIDSATNNFRNAFEHLKKKDELRQLAYDGQKEAIALDLNERYQTEALKQKIAGIEDKLSQAGHETKFRNSIAVIVVIIASVLMIAGIIQISLYYRERRIEKSISAENEQNKEQVRLLAGQVDRYTKENQQLVRENIGLEKSNAVKDKLLSIISHDLRSPMSSLQALLGLYNTNSIARTDLVDFFGKLLSRVENTSTMLENLLQWSQYQLNGIEPIFDKVDIQEIIDDSINFYRMQAEQKRIMIDNSLKTSVFVRADVEMLKIILRNLISNALKFTRTEGIITIKALTKEGSVIVSVKDTGVGISPENQAKMFAMNNFTTPGTEQEKGTGLGLMLCKDFVEHNQGRIWLDSKVNVGTTFYFSIPLAEE